MRKFSYIFILLCFIGCSTVEIPSYIQDQNPYKRTLYAGFEQVLEASTSSLEAAGWKVSGTFNPAEFEHNKENLPEESKQIGLSTKVRQTSFVFGSSYSRLNVYIYSVSKNQTDVEIRYLKITSYPFKSFNDFRNDPLSASLLKSIEEKLN